MAGASSKPARPGVSTPEKAASALKRASTIELEQELTHSSVDKFIEQRAMKFYSNTLWSWILGPIPLWLGPTWMVDNFWLRAFFLATTVFGVTCKLLFSRGYISPQMGAYLNIFFCFTVATVFCIFTGGLYSADIMICFFQVQVCNAFLVALLKHADVTGPPSYALIHIHLF